MEEKLKNDMITLIEMFNDNKISLSELYFKISKLKTIENSQIFESTLKSVSDTSTMLLLITYKISETLK